ncbi:hypothetical protein M3P36_13515 [Altererythrobacter sp. KTW20L]|uniref:hypothetical protein n=1 Tax=Altererythrobacter sp. KTW20L TaxID=2942210 RepID=UPI0020BEE45A|nr:hypothetical protein [Altererythrobacter sp. KTW20L]MCL6252059.1 hypothetical protein [Altererythrobacter sp. KTW20L]
MPLSLDGRDGRQLQRIMINDAIDSILRNPTIVIEARKRNSSLLRTMTDLDLRATVVDDVMNEFACVLDADNIRKGTTEGESYCRAPREQWQMQLESAEDVSLILEIHECYRIALREQSFLSMDQMIADYSRYLSTHEWSQLRDRIGFDVIFVDEYHYFTRLEAMTLHNLFKSRASFQKKWPLIMAYDLKQSVSDAGLSGGVERFRNPGVGETVPVDLKQVYRATPEIAQFLQSLDGAFPAMDLEGEFQAYEAQSSQDSGEIPTCIEFETDVSLVNAIFEQAVEDARHLEGGGRDVAVLCASENLFDRYRKAPRILEKCVPMTTREDLRQLSYAKRKVIFSMPEYVAGLQFSSVYIIHLDEVDLSEDNLSVGGRRRYVSRVYLGASRASKKLTIATSKARGGLGSVLSGALADGTLRKI